MQHQNEQELKVGFMTKYDRFHNKIWYSFFKYESNLTILLHCCSKGVIAFHHTLRNIHIYTICYIIKQRYCGPLSRNTYLEQLNI